MDVVQNIYIHVCSLDDTSCTPLLSNIVCQQNLIYAYTTKKQYMYYTNPI